MANIGCGIDSVIERVEKIKSVLRKYSIINAGAASWGPIKSFTTSIDIPLVDWFSNFSGSGTVKSLYESISNVYNTVSEGIETANNIKKAYEGLVNDFGTVVSNLSGILEDIKDMTVLDIQILELDLAKFGLSPGHVIDRIKSGESLEQIFKDLNVNAKPDDLSEQSKALLQKLSKPITFNINTTCQKLPNIQIIEVGNVRRVYTWPSSPQPPKADIGHIPITVQPDTFTAHSGNIDTSAYIRQLSKVDSKYNWQWLSNGHDVPRFRHTITVESIEVARAVAHSLGMRSLFNEIELNRIKLNLNAIGYYIIRPLKDKYKDNIIITSGYRAAPLTAKKTLSNHAIGCAVDFQFPASAEHLFKNKNDNPILFINNLLKNINITVNSNSVNGTSVSKRIGKFRLIREYRSIKPRSFVAPTYFHLDANFVFESKGNLFAVLPRASLALDSYKFKHGDDVEPFY